MLLGLTASLLAAVVYGGIAAVQASVIRRHGMWSRTMVIVVVAYVGGWGLHLIAIAHLPLYLAQIGVSSSLVVTALLAAFVLGEPMRPEHWAAVVALVGGLGVLALASGRVGRSAFTDTTTFAIYAALVVTSALGWLAWRSKHRYSGIALSILSGVAYGISPIATRALIDFSWDLDSYATAVAIGLSGSLGFVLYSCAFSRASVTAATAPQILLQTAIPSAVGVMLFEDHVRGGWWPAAIAAFAVAAVASIVLSGTEARLEMIEDAFEAGPEDGTKDGPKDGLSDLVG